MTFFVDANAILYSVSEGPARESCLRLLRAVAAGEADGRTSPAVLEEVWHVSRRQGQERSTALVEGALAIFSPLLPVTEEALVSALGLAGEALGANDRIHLGTCAAHGIDTVLTADRAFDGLAGIHRVDPLDAAAVERLLAAGTG